MPSILKPTYSEDLPIHARREEIIRAIQQNQIVVIAGETGSGKTTQIPKFLLDAGYGKNGLIGCTQPRRVAALSVAQRIAEELGVTYGNEVGAKIRFTDQTRHDTAIKVMTDGILLAETQRDRHLLQYDCIIIDEAHERSLNIDFLLGYLKSLLVVRPDLKVVISSATLDARSFSEFFNHAPVIEVEGRVYPVEDFFLPPGKDEELSNHILRAMRWISDVDDQGDGVAGPDLQRLGARAGDLLARGGAGPAVPPLRSQLVAIDQSSASPDDRPCSTAAAWPPEPVATVT